LEVFEKSKLKESGGKAAATWLENKEGPRRKKKKAARMIREVRLGGCIMAVG
jgi:hypothetical protein